MKRLFPVLTILLLGACGNDDPVAGTDAGTDTPTADTTPDGAADAEPDVTTDTTGDADGDTVSDAPDGDTPAPAMIEIVYENVFADACGGGFCHLGTQQAGGVNLELSDTLEADLVTESSVSGLNLIEPGDPTSSYLYLKSTGEFSAVGGSGGQMPLGAPPLTDEQLELMADWITGLE